MGIEPLVTDFHVMHAIAWANSPISGCLGPLDPYIGMLYWSLDLETFLESIELE